MLQDTHTSRRTRRTIAVAVSLLLTLSVPLIALANVPLTQISTDPFTNTTSQHATEVEPDTFSAGSTIVATFQQGRFFNGGASDIGWATSTNGGATWTHDSLPCITKFLFVGCGSLTQYDRVSDPVVAFDAAHNVWLISSLAILEVPGGINGQALLVSRSTNGGTTWSNPVNVAVATGNADLDKNWTVCDNTSTSPFFGHCYTQYDDFGNGNQVHMSTSTDGGLTWTEATVPSVQVIGGQPVVQPNGTVIVPIDNAFETAIFSLVSTDGGVTYTGPFAISNITDHAVAGGLRSGPLPSAEIDGSGKVYVVWQDCRFESGCTANDIVMSTSTDGVAWSPVTRIPIDPVGSGVDHFIPGLAVDKATSGSTAHLGLTYYFYPNANCRTNNCQLNVGFVSSVNGGASWSTPTQLTGPMNLSWLADTNQGRMVGDYISTSFAGGTSHPVFAAANPPSRGKCSTRTVCDEAMYSPTTGLLTSAAGGVVTTPSGEHPVPNAASDHAAPQARFTVR